MRPGGLVSGISLFYFLVEERDPGRVNLILKEVLQDATSTRGALLLSPLGLGVPMSRRQSEERPIAVAAGELGVGG